MAEGATVANAFVQIMPSMEGATSNITSAIMPGIENAGNTAGSKFGSLFSGKMSVAMKGLGAALIGYVGISAMKDAFVSVEAGLNNVKIATGATGEQAKELEAAYLEASRNVVGSFEDIGSALGELNTRFGLEGDALTKATEQTMKYAKVTGQDATSAVQDVASMMNNAGISTDEFGTVLDELTVAGQASGISVSQLAQAVNSNAAVMKEMGFSTEDTIAMLANFEKTGADTTGILAAMKKGVQNWTKEGISAKDGFAEFVKGVQEGSIDAQKSIEIFGAKGGLAMYDAAQKGQLSFDEMYDAIVNESAGALDAVYNDTLTAQEKFDVLGKNIQAGFYEIAEPIVDAVAPYMDEVISAVAGAVRWFTTNAVPPIKEFIRLVGVLIEGLVHTANEFYSAAQDAVQFASTVASTIAEAVSNIVSWWSQVPDRIAGFVSDLAQRVKAHFQGIIDFAMSIPDRIIGFFAGLGSAISNAIGSIHFPTPHVSWEPLEIAGMSTPINLPHVSWYGKGGYFDDATIIGVGERGGEYIVPDYEPYISRLSSAISEHMEAGGIVINEMTVVADDPEDFMNQLTAFAARTRAQYA